MKWLCQLINWMIRAMAAAISFICPCMYEYRVWGKPFEYKSHQIVIIKVSCLQRPIKLSFFLAQEWLFDSWGGGGVAGISHLSSAALLMSLELVTNACCDCDSANTILFMVELHMQREHGEMDSSLLEMLLFVKNSFIPVVWIGFYGVITQVSECSWQLI